MPNIASVLKDEILRLARKEVRTATESLKKASAAYRSDIASLKRQVAALEKQLARGEKKRAAASEQVASASVELSTQASSLGEVVLLLEQIVNGADHSASVEATQVTAPREKPRMQKRPSARLRHAHGHA